MLRFITRRLLSLIPLMLGISMLVFLLMYLAPGDFLSEARNSKDISPEIVKQEEIRLGLDKPWYIQYGRWLNGVSPVKTNLLLPDNERGKHGLVYLGAPNFGYSWSYKISVSELIGQRFFPTLWLALASTLVIYVVSVPLGVLAAVKQNSIFDKLSAFLAYAALSIPTAVIAKRRDSKITIFQQDTRFLAKKRPPQINTRTHNGLSLIHISSAASLVIKSTRLKT